MFTYVVDYNNGNLLIIKTSAPKEVFDKFINECKKDETSAYEALLTLLFENNYEYKIVIDTYDIPTYEI